MAADGALHAPSFLCSDKKVSFANGGLKSAATATPGNHLRRPYTFTFLIAGSHSRVTASCKSRTLTP